MRIAVLGTGNVGTVLADGFLNANHDVVIGSRSPKGRSGLAGPVTSFAEAAGSADVIVNATPGSNSIEALRPIAAQLEGKILIDVANAITPEWSLAYPNSSVGAALQEEFPSARVVKTLNTITAEVMANPKLLAGETSVFISGDNAEAKFIVATLLSDLGWSTANQIDLGDISSARATEHYLFLSMAIMNTVHSTAYNIALIQ